LVRWAQRSNLSHVITDCPHRERLGWLEQYHLNGPALRYEFDLTRLYAKCFQDMEDAQLANGLVPDIAPEFVTFGDGFRDSPEWGSALILAGWQHFVWTGDDEPLRAHFGAMVRYLAYLEGRSENGIVSHGLGDWYDLGPKPPGKAQLTPVALTATAIYYECICTLELVATQLGKTDEAKHCATQAETVRQAFNRKFFNIKTSVYARGSQTAQAMPLVLDLVDPAQRDAVLAGLVRDIASRGNAITAGDVGYRYLLRALAQEERSDVIYAMNNQSEKPGYGYQLAKGCTSLAEAWTADRTSSQNHFMLGQIMEWFYGSLVGLAPDPGAPGFKRVIIRPQPVEGVEWAEARYQSPRGPIAVLWRKAEHRFFLRAEIPPNVSAEVWIRTRPGDVIEESGEPAVKRPGVRLERIQNGYAVFSVESGDFDFSVRTQ
jgi:alpha-L-rhamnosidase